MPAISDTVTLHEGDLPDDFAPGDSLAVDTETMGLLPGRDRLCVVQLSTGDGTAHLVRLPQGNYAAPNLVRVLGDPAVLKLFHFARFDVAVLRAYLGVEVQPIWCTKIASKLVRTYTDRHGLKDLCRELLGVDLSKAQQSSDWGADTLTAEQCAYAANDVLHLHRLKAALEAMLIREQRLGFAERCFGFLPTRAALDLAGFAETDIFSH